MLPKCIEWCRESLRQFCRSRGKTISASITPERIIEEIILRKVKRKSVSVINQATADEKTFASYWDWRKKSTRNLPMAMEFLEHTSLHGLKYIGGRKEHCVERIFWIIAFLIGLVLSFYMISDVWKKYRNNTVITTFNPYETKIEEIPFPAITICNMNMILKSKAEHIIRQAARSRKTDVQSAREDLYYLNHVCSASKSFSKMFNYSIYRGKIDDYILNKANQDEEHYDGDKEDLWAFLEKASPSCEAMIPLCMWEEKVIEPNCSKLFKQIETDYGFCCVFNMVPPSILHRLNLLYSSSSEEDEDPDAAEDWTWDGDSLLKKNDENGDSEFLKFPRRQKLAGKSFGLSILLNPKLDEYFCTSSDSVGFRIVAHLPIDVPHVTDFGSAIPPNSEVFVEIHPEVILAEKENIGSFTKEQRRCYFSGEHTNLAYYQYYTSTNCIDECIANLTLQECKCARHYMPRDDDATPLCGPKQFSCASTIKSKLAGSVGRKKSCEKCFPTCTEIIYHSEFTHTPMQNPKIVWETITDNKRVFAEWVNQNVSIVHIYFGEDSTNAKVRKALYSTVDLIANFGGLMGLCLGFSGLSLVELIYFFTLRLWFHGGTNKKNTDEKDASPFMKMSSPPNTGMQMDVQNEMHKNQLL